MALRSVVTIPPGTEFIVTKDGGVRHVEEQDGVHQSWCHMVYVGTKVEPYRYGIHGSKPICGACLRTTKAQRFIR